MAHKLLTALTAILFLAGDVYSAETKALEREEVRQALSGADAPARRQAAARLGEIGVMADTELLQHALHDEDADTRENAEHAMWQIWTRSGSRQVDRLFEAGVGQMREGDLHKAIATFSRIIRLKPAFAEGWNKRATLYFLAGEYQKSLADCKEVIKRNPAHFGALAGYGQIYLRLEDYERAREYFHRALEVNPNMDSVRLNIVLLDKLIEQKRRNMI